MQYNRESNRGWWVRDLCKVVDNSTNSAIDNYRNLFSTYYQIDLNNATQCWNASYADDMDSLEGTGYSSQRAWVYQTCTEFGYYQSTDGHTPFGKYMPLKYFLQMCADVFGLDIRTFPRIEQTNEIYGALHPGSSKVLFTNCGWDEWQTLSITKSQPGLPAYVTPEGAHCCLMK